MRATGRARIGESAERPAGSAGVDTLLDPALIARYRDEMASGAPGLRAAQPRSASSTRRAVPPACRSPTAKAPAYVFPGTGIILNNMLGEADLNPGRRARLADATCRMASMMTPAIVLDGDGGVPRWAPGGSNRIRTAMLQALLNLLVFDMRLEEAIAAPRLHVGRDGNAEPGAGLSRGRPSLRWRALRRASSAGRHRTCSSAACMRYGGAGRGAWMAPATNAVAASSAWLERVRRALDGRRMTGAQEDERYILTISCPDRTGIVAAVAGFLADHDAFITKSSHFGDP